MKFRAKNCVLAGEMAVVLFCLASTATLAQQGAAPAVADGRGAGGGRGAADEAAIAKAAALPTPKAADGHPDFTGYWANNDHNQGRGGETSADGKTILAHIGPPRAVEGPGSAQRLQQRVDDPGRPIYKPELAAKMKALAADANHQDPAFICKPVGVPRMGAPTEIIQTPNTIVFLYELSEKLDVFRLVFTDGRPHDKTLAPSYNGDSIGHWEGNTLVVDVTGFNDETWLDADGSFHTEALHVVERLTRQGNTLRYEVTADDPNVLAKPWVAKPRTILKGKPNEHVIESDPCFDEDRSHMVTGDRF